MAILNNSNAISSGGYDVNNSVRLRRSATGYLSRTPSTSNRKTWTWSGWVKRGVLSYNYSRFFAASDGSGNNEAVLSFGASDTLSVYSYIGAYQLQLQTTQVFRDPSAWYHIVVALDTTQATAANRCKVYINGTQVTAFSTATYPSQNYDGYININQPHALGYDRATSESFDGYLAEVNFIDGSAKTPSDFGETDTTTGSWKPKAYTGTYGTNGFYLKFSDIATTSGSNAGLGKDFSGNANYWTTNNISVTAGTTYDAMIDSPTLTSATVANYAVLNPLNLASSGVTSTNANLLATSTGAAYRSLTSTIDLPTGSWYFEITAGASSAGDNVIVGIQSVTENLQSNYVGSSATSYAYGSSGNKYNAGTAVAYGATWTSGDVIGIAFNGSTLTFYKNNTSQGNAYTGLSGNFVFSVSAYNSSASVNFGQRPFAYTPPTGFVRLNTYNLPDSTIKKGNTVMDATLWTGTGGARTITNAAGFRPDWVWVKRRSSADDHYSYDSVRGANLNLVENSTVAEANVTGYGGGGIGAATSTGFTIVAGTSNADNLNGSGITYVAWQWQAGQGSSSSNTSGSITSTVSASTTAGFSIVTYTGTGANATVGHGLGVAPKMIITRYRGSESWSVYHTSLGGTKTLYLNLTNAANTTSLAWNNTDPTSTVFSLGSAGTTNTSGSPGMVAYCWSAIPGYSAFTSYTGNGSTDGPFIFLGFRPKFVMIKRTDGGTNNWVIFDSSRNTYNATGKELKANTSAAEYDGDSTNPNDFLSNGLKIRHDGTAMNIASGTYIVAAWAENPFKNSNAR